MTRWPRTVLTLSHVILFLIMATIQLEEVTRRYGHRPSRTASAEDDNAPEIEEAPAESGVLALDNLSLTIPNGRTMAIVGPSGCGKSTLLRVIAGLDLEYDGEVYYDGRNMRDVPPRQRYMGMVFQSYALYPHFHGYNNLRFTFLMRKRPDAEAVERIRITSDMMGYGFRQLLGRKPGHLSGGEQQRLALARALVRAPDVLLLDEPLSNLDAKLRVQTRVEMKRLLRQFNITTVYVTHDQVEALSLADTIAVMRDGRVIQVGSYNHIRTAPVNTFVAGFLGIHPLNLLPAKVVDTNTMYVGGMQLKAPQGLSLRNRIGAEVTVGVSADDLVVQPMSAGDDAKQSVLGHVLVTEPDFARKKTFVRIETAYGAVTATAELNVPLVYGQTVHIRNQGGSVQVYNSANGRNLALTV